VAGVLCVESVTIGRVSEQRISDGSANTLTPFNPDVLGNVEKSPLLYAGQSQKPTKNSGFARVTNEHYNSSEINKHKQRVFKTRVLQKGGSLSLSNLTHLSAEKVHFTAVIKATSILMVRPTHVTNECKCKGITQIPTGTGRGCNKKKSRQWQYTYNSEKAFY
jgi:hypothetical protein